jgi:hypothetical protein
MAFLQQTDDWKNLKNRCLMLTSPTVEIEKATSAGW